MDTATLLQYSTDNQHFHYYHHHQSPYSRTRNTQTGLFRSSTLPVLDKTASLINGSSGGVFLNPRIPISSSSSSSFTRPLYPIQPPLLPLPAMAAFTTTKSIHQSLPTLPPPPAQKKHKGTINSKKKSTKDSQQITNPSKRSSSNTKGSNKNTTIDVTKVDSIRTGAVVQRVGGEANNEKVVYGDDQMMGFPDDDSVFAVSPPPSSLPLPKFSLRPKVVISSSNSSCNLEAHTRTSIGDGVHLDAAGATDNLCRILNLR